VSVHRPNRVPGRSGHAAVLSVVIAMLGAIHPAASAIDGAVDHLLISELMTGGASASDEFIEVYNPGTAALPLEGLELVYVTASGATISRRAAWAAGSPVVGPGEHVLVANEAGIFAGIADALYAAGIAAAGGSVALRIQGASGAIDAVGWGTAASSWMEGLGATAPAAGQSLERLPGGTAGSGQDTDSNVADFAVRPVPDPQNSGSAPVPDPGASPTPRPSPAVTGSPVATASVTAAPSPTATATPSTTGTPAPAVLPIADARALPDGSTATISGVALTTGDFTDGGGYVTDASGGIAVLVTGGTFARGALLEVTGEVDDRFHQRTLRVDVAGMAVTGSGGDPAPLLATTGSINEAVEARLVAIGGSIVGPPTELTTGTAFDVDDGSGVARVIVQPTTGIDLVSWTAGAHVELIGVVGQRDSSGTGIAGYRVHPRDPADIQSLIAAPSVTPSPTGGPDSSPGATATPPGTPLVSVATARAATTGTRLRVRGTVTLGSGVVADASAVIEDATGAILVRIGSEAGSLTRGDVVELAATRSTKSGMASLRISQPAVVVGHGTEPEPLRIATGAAGEDHEARLLAVRGALLGTPRRAKSGTLSFEVDDGSGALRVVIYPATGITATGLAKGAWVEIRGVLGQETSGSQPLRGYRLWPRSGSDLVVLAAAQAAEHLDAPDADGSSTRGGSAGRPSLNDLLVAGRATAGVSATLVAGPWPDLGLAGVLWDGERAVGIVDEPTARSTILGLLDSAGLPTAVEADLEPPIGTHHELPIPLVRLSGAGGLAPVGDTPAAPATAVPSSGPAVWVRLSGTLGRGPEGPTLVVGAGRVALEVRCRPSPLPSVGVVVEAAGLGVATPRRLVVGCHGIRRGPDLVAAGVVSAMDAEKAPSPTAPIEEVASSAHVASAAVLLVGALLAGGACAAVWVRRRPQGMALDVAELGTDERGEAAPGDALPGGEGGVLVALPRERGSP